MKRLGRFLFTCYVEVSVAYYLAGDNGSVLSMLRARRRL